MSNGSVQVRLDLTAIQHGVACFGSGAQAEYCAVMEVAGSHQSLAKLDDAKQEEMLAAYSQILNSLTFPFQLLVRVHPVDLSWYAARVEERARALSPALIAIARDHAAYVQGLTRQRSLFERRVFIVLPWSSPVDAGNKLDGAGSSLLRFLGRRGSRANAETHAVQEEMISRQLTDRCDVIGRQLSRAGMRATRLDDLGLAQLYHVSWAPEVSRTQRLRRELADYTALVVGADIPGSRRKNVPGD
jgi:hypothetical protein